MGAQKIPAVMVARLIRTDKSRQKYPTSGLPDVIELRVDEETDFLVGSSPRAEGEVDFCDVLRLHCRTHPQLLSRKHAYIVLDDEGCHCIRDLDTLNGTYINGNLIPNELVKLKNGDVIGFGGPISVCLNGTSTVNPTCTPTITTTKRILFSTRRRRVSQRK